MRTGYADGFRSRSEQIHWLLATLRPARQRDQDRSAEWVRGQDFQRTPRTRPATAVFLSRTAREQLRSLYQRSHDTKRNRERDVAVCTGNRDEVRLKDWSIVRPTPSRPERRA